MTAEILLEFLEKNNVDYLTIQHSPAYTAQEIAASAGIPGKELAKSVIVKVDGELAMAVLPASFGVNFQKLKKAVGGRQVELAAEDEFKDQFPDCELGAMPPFGNLYGLEVYVDESLAEDQDIAFNACRHSELIKMSYLDFEALVKPTVVNFTRPSLQRDIA